jgi:molybdopterin molybdotransferase
MMISFEEANKIVQEAIKPLGTEHVPLQNALHRILAEDYISDSDFPPFNKSAMDGFACRRSELNNILKVVANIPAGIVPQVPFGRNECMRITTGAMVPEGADQILKKEDAEEIGSGSVKCMNVPSESNICLKGEDIRKGDMALKSGCLLGPQHIAVLASDGALQPLVFKQPTVAILSTGNELVEPEEQPQLSQIRDSNGYQLSSQVRQMGLKPDYLGIAGDDKAILTSILSSALEKYQLIIISGGVSVGDLDYVPDVLKNLGVKILFHRMKTKPGKHLLFGTRGSQYIFAFPGNPVSAFVQFEVMVKPFIMKWMGNRGHSPILTMPLAERYKRSSPELMFFLPVFFNGQGSVKMVDYHGSAHINSYTLANGILEIPAGVSEINKGEFVHVRPL